MIKIVSVILARGGSKRIPNKNILQIKGKPLIGYAIEASKQCLFIHKTWVSTDSDEIMLAAFRHNALCLKRPDELCQDTSSSEDALLHFANSVDFDVLVFLQCTSPLTKPYQLEEGIEKILSGSCDSVLSVCEDKRFYWNSNKQPINYDPLNRVRSQDKEMWYKETGAFYITTRDALLKSKCRISGKIDFVVVPEKESFEIDTIDDFQIIEKLL